MTSNDEPCTHLTAGSCVCVFGRPTHAEPSVRDGRDPHRWRHARDEFKAGAVAVSAQPGMSMAAVEMARAINANLLRRRLASVWRMLFNM